MDSFVLVLNYLIHFKFYYQHSKVLLYLSITLFKYMVFILFELEKQHNENKAKFHVLVNKSQNLNTAKPI